MTLGGKDCCLRGTSAYIERIGCRCFDSRKLSIIVIFVGRFVKPISSRGDGRQHGWKTCRMCLRWWKGWWHWSKRSCCSLIPVEGKFEKMKGSHPREGNDEWKDYSSDTSLCSGWTRCPSFFILRWMEGLMVSGGVSWNPKKTWRSCTKMRHMQKRDYSSNTISLQSYTCGYWIYSRRGSSIRMDRSLLL